HADEMRSARSDDRMQGIADRYFDLCILEIDCDLAQLLDALRLRHFLGEAELLQDSVGPGEQGTLALGLGLRVLFGTWFPERDDTSCHCSLPSRKVSD